MRIFSSSWQQTSLHPVCDLSQASVLRITHRVFFLGICKDPFDELLFRYDHAAADAQPTTPAEPTTPSEPTTPAEPETPTQPAEPETPAQPVTPAQPEQPAAPVAAGSYTVKKGDTYGTIALNNYGTYGVWSELYKANKGVKLTEGATLVLPEKLGKVARINAPAAASGETLYTVKAGDTLGAIAKATYGDVMKYKTIFERNADRLVNANTIYEGQVIVLPAK